MAPARPPRPDSARRDRKLTGPTGNCCRWPSRAPAQTGRRLVVADRRPDPACIGLHALGHRLIGTPTVTLSRSPHFSANSRRIRRAQAAARFSAPRRFGSRSARNCAASSALGSVPITSIENPPQEHASEHGFAVESPAARAWRRPVRQSARAPRRPRLFKGRDRLRSGRRRQPRCRLECAQTQGLFILGRQIWSPGLHTTGQRPLFQRSIDTLPARPNI